MFVEMTPAVVAPEKTALVILRAAREVIADPACWTKGAFAADESNTECDQSAPEATRWCSLGAIYRVSGYVPGDGMPDRERHAVLEKVIAALSLATGRPQFEHAQRSAVWVADWNDNVERTHQEVMAAFVRAEEWL